MINNKTYDFITFSQLMSSVRSGMESYDEMGLIDDVECMKVVMSCNEKLGLVFSEMKQVILPIQDFKGDLPIDFYKVYYMAALDIRHFSVNNLVNPWNNQIDQTVTYECDVKRGVIGCAPNTTVIYKKQGSEYIQNYLYWDELAISKYKMHKCYPGAPIKNVGTNVVNFSNDNEILTPFREGEVFMMYLAAMVDENGETLVPFHPMITPWYEWSIKEAIITNTIINSDDVNTQNAYAITERKKGDAWLDAFNFTSDRTYREMMADKKAREMKWYNQYYAMLK
jgi:hypothetical protein